MAKKKKQGRKYQITFFDGYSLEEIRSFRLSSSGIFNILGGTVLLIFILAFLIIIFTPLHRLLPSSNGYALKNEAIKNALQIDSLETSAMREHSYLMSLKNILDGKITTDTFDERTIYHQDTTESISAENFKPGNLDSILKEDLQIVAIKDKPAAGKTDTKETMENLHFRLPLKGVVTNEFDAGNLHYGIDVVPGKDETVLATLSGTVILNTWSMETGYVIGIQHNWNLISFYKHNSVLLKEQGDKVESGEPIAVVGNSGEQSTGPHLHFELWFNGNPVNPRDYISF
ncbi:MAG: peptidase M23 [Bacteroidia bacterium]|nr:MAG: peptidase M23 [Bacteroidia bacterium]